MKKLDKLLDCIKELNIDLLFVSNNSNVRYLSGFTGSSGSILFGEDTRLFFTDLRYSEQASKEISGFEIIAENKPLPEILKSVKTLNKRKIGIESEHISLKDFNELSGIVSKNFIVPTENIIEDIAAQKSEYEIEQVKRACEISEKSFKEIINFIKPGITEKDIETELIYTLYKNGSENFHFEPIVLSGQRTSLIHGRASNKILKSGDNILLDFGGVINGYGADISRMVFLGDISGIIKEAFDSVTETIAKTIEEIRVKKDAKSLDLFARNVLRERGFLRYFPHSLGHGLGLKGHYKPLISYRSRNILQSNNIFTIEPGIYIEGKFGIRVEENILLEDNGPDILTDFKREPMIIE